MLLLGRGVSRFLVQPHESNQFPQPLAEQWERIIMVEGCLIGHQDWHDGIENSRDFQQGCLLATEPFQAVIHAEPNVVKPFLFAKLASEYQTQSHVCPYQHAVEGELALYLLQHITHRNWYDYQGDNQFITDQIGIRQALLNHELPYSPATTDQHLVRNILTNPESRNALIEWYTGASLQPPHPGDQENR
jgi:hypothetical protein